MQNGPQSSGLVEKRSELRCALDRLEFQYRRQMKQVPVHEAGVWMAFVCLPGWEIMQCPQHAFIWIIKCI